MSCLFRRVKPRLIRFGSETTGLIAYRTLATLDQKKGVNPILQSG